jgi:hypothetical protein
MLFVFPLITFPIGLGVNKLDFFKSLPIFLFVEEAIIVSVTNLAQLVPFLIKAP